MSSPTVPLYGPLNIPHGPLNTGSRLGNTALSTGIRLAGSMVPIPGAGSAIGGIGTGLITGNWNWRNFVPFGWLIPGKPNYGIIGNVTPSLIPGAVPSINSKNFMQGLPQIPNFSAAPNFAGNPLALLQYVAMNSGYGVPGVAQGNRFTGLNNPAQFAPPQQTPTYLQQGTPYQSQFAGAIPDGFWQSNDNAGQAFVGGGGLGSCFSGNAQLDGLGRFDSLPDEITLSDGRKATVLTHYHDGPMRDMGDGELVTLDHPMLNHEGKLVPASEIFSAERPFTGKVYNLHIHTEHEHERYYRLKNGWVAHNKPGLDPQSMIESGLGAGARGWFA